MTRPLEVLFVEDSELDVELATRTLRKEGLELRGRVVASEEELRAALGTPPDVILSDFSMPQFDGLSALRLARTLAPEVPFIFVSGTIGEERAIEAIRGGATDYVLKDNLRRLATAVRRALAEADERRRSRAAQEERARLAQILEATPDLVGMADPEGRHIYLNAAGRRLTGVKDDELPGKPVRDLCPAWARERLEREARPAAIRDGVWQGESAVLSADGREIPVSQVILAHRDEAGEVRYFSTLSRDISERKEYEARIRYLANYDGLCALPNRNLLADRAAQALAQARRSGRGCGLLVLNIDRFKLLNDAYGRPAGDVLLKQVAVRLANAAREGETAARLAGDTFAVLAPGLARPEQLGVLARKIQDAVAPAFVADGHKVSLTLSLGASFFPRDGEDFELLLRNAEAAMQRSRDAGGNRVQYYAAAMTEAAAERLDLEDALRGAVSRGEVELHYQPQVEVPTGRIAGVEALMRWRHPSRGAVSPAKFIPIAEESSLICTLGEWALGEGCRQLAAWSRAGLPPLRLAVNVSARHFREPGLVETVERVLGEHGLSGGRLELEITEGTLIEDRDQALETLKALKALGVLVAVDDFGTGYSSLSYLSGLPVDCLKIDRAFVTHVCSRARDAAIAQAVISMGHALGMRVLAEGVETAQQREFLEAYGCDEAQGYFYARPCRADEAAALAAAPALAGKPAETR